jgi:hypothetical protein
MNAQLYIYAGSALAGLVFHWVKRGKAQADRPSGVSWIMANYGYALGSLGLTMGSALFFMPTELGLNANAAALAMGIAGGSAIKNLFTSAK